MADLCSFDIQLQFFGQICCKGILTGLNVTKTLNDDGGMFGRFVVMCILRNRRNFKCRFACIIFVGVWRRRGNTKDNIEITAYSNDDNAMTRLRNAVLLEFIEMRRDGIPSFTQL